MVSQDDQTCAGLKTVTGGAVYWVQAIWDENLTTKDWEFLLEDTKNAFNKIN